MAAQRTYLAIDLKSFYASVECVDRHLDPLTTNLVVADASRTEKTICLAVSPSLKAYRIPGRARLFEAVQRVKEVNAQRLQTAIRQKKAVRGEDGKYHFASTSFDANALNADPALTVRRITINANKVTPDEGIYQVDFFTDTRKLEKEKKLQQAMLGIKNKYGKNAVLKASSYEEGATMRQRNAQIGGHSAGGSAGGSDGKLQK